MSACEFHERVAAFASGEPDEVLAAHLPGCASCRAELEAARVLLRELAPLRGPARADAEGELHWADFTRGVRAGLEQAKREEHESRRTKSARLAWLAAPALCAAAALVWALAGRQLASPTEGRVAVAPAQVVAPPADDEDDDLWLSEPDPAASLAELDDAELNVLLAQLDAEGDEAADEADPEGVVEGLDDEQLDAVAATLTL